MLLVRRWVAGSTIADAVRRARQLQGRRMLVCVDYLGEHDVDKASVRRSTAEYLRLVPQLRGMDADISLKPSELGMDISFREAERNITAILKAARAADVGAWLDMESSHYTENTLRLHRALAKRFPKLGIAIQANLKRTPRDIRALARMRARVRLVKGAYAEDERIAFTDWAEVTAQYRILLGALFHSRCFVAVGTHDPKMIAEAKRLAPAHQGGYEFQLLLGIGERLKRELLADGQTVRVYLPYGKRWQKYVLRRIRERKRDTLRVIRLAFS